MGDHEASSFEDDGLSLLEQLAWHFLKAGRFRIELWRLNELEEEIGETATETLERGFVTTAVQHVCLTINQFNNFTRQIAIEFLNGPLSV